MKAMVRQLYQKCVWIDPEFDKTLRLIDNLAVPHAKILDVGCGQGRFLKPLHAKGYQVTGVEINPEMVDKLNRQQYRCITPEALQASDDKYDLILMSHIIEHFTPKDLFDFMESYLQRLSNNGHLVILTPLYSSYFYDDFDHIKPYHPTGLQMIYSKDTAQVQFRSKYHLELVDLWYRRSPFLPSKSKAVHMKTAWTSMYHALRFLSCLCYRASVGLLGRKDGWVGVFQKS